MPGGAGALHTEGVGRRTHAADAAVGGGGQGALEVRLPECRSGTNEEAVVTTFSFSDQISVLRL